MKEVLVAGAIGYLGRFVVQGFKKQGYYVRALTRSAAKLDDIGDYIDEKFIAKITEMNSITGICKDIGAWIIISGVFVCSVINALLILAD